MAEWMQNHNDFLTAMRFFVVSPYESHESKVRFLKTLVKTAIATKRKIRYNNSISTIALF